MTLLAITQFKARNRFGDSHSAIVYPRKAVTAVQDNSLLESLNMKQITTYCLAVFTIIAAGCGGGGGGGDSVTEVADVTGTYRIDATISENECGDLFNFSGYFENPHVVTQEGNNVTVDTGTLTVLNLGPAKTPDGFTGSESQQLSPSLAVVFTVDWSATSEGVFDVTYDFFRFPLESPSCRVIWQGTATRIS